MPNANKTDVRRRLLLRLRPADNIRRGCAASTWKAVSHSRSVLRYQLVGSRPISRHATRASENASACRIENNLVPLQRSAARRSHKRDRVATRGPSTTSSVIMFVEETPSDGDRSADRFVGGKALSAHRIGPRKKGGEDTVGKERDGLRRCRDHQPTIDPIIWRIFWAVDGRTTRCITNEIRQRDAKVGSSE